MKRRVAFFISMLFVVISISGCSKYLGGATEENNSVKEEKQGLLFSTEYEVQDYFYVFCKVKLSSATIHQTDRSMLVFIFIK